MTLLLPDSLLPDQTELRPGQRAAVEAARAEAMPTTEAEHWRYSRIDNLSLDGVTLATPGGVELPEPAGRIMAAMDGASAVCELDVGRLSGWANAAAPVVSLDSDTGPVETTGDETNLLNAALCPEVHALEVQPRRRVDDPVVVSDQGPVAGQLAAPRIRLVVGDEAKVTFVHLVANRGGVMVPVVELIAGDDAQVSLVTVHAGEPSGWLLGRLAVQAGRGTEVGLRSVSLGAGGYSRLRIDADLEGDAAHLDNRALYLGTGDSQHDYRVHQRHVGRHSTSRLLLRGAVRGLSQGVFTGVVRIEKGARGSDGSQDARHLKLEDGTHVDSVPSLEIEENQVSCSHASSISPLDADQMFYLESRGIPSTVAARLLARGFLRATETGLEAAGLGAVISDMLSEALAPEIEPMIR